jgi:hypothetical protein
MVKNMQDGEDHSDKGGQNPNHPQPKQIRFVEENVKTLYSNVFNIGFGSEEVVFLFGNHSLDPNVVKIESKMAVSHKTAKRLALTLGNLIRRYEAIHGELDISVPKNPEEKPNIQ